jgi:hypothetical protein
VRLLGSEPGHDIIRHFFLVILPVTQEGHSTEMACVHRPYSISEGGDYEVCEAV